jgi:hypothetical protein
VKKKAVPVYLDDYERRLLELLASEWGCGYSAAFKRLLREKQEGK